MELQLIWSNLLSELIMSTVKIYSIKSVLFPLVFMGTKWSKVILLPHQKWVKIKDNLQILLNLTNKQWRNLNNFKYVKDKQLIINNLMLQKISNKEFKESKVSDKL